MIISFWAGPLDISDNLFVQYKIIIIIITFYKH